MNKWIEDWRNRKDGFQKQHKRFLRKLQQHKGKRLDKFADQLHEAVFQDIDCLDCANCCTSIPPIVNKTDAARLAKHLGMSLSDFEAQYLTVDEDKDTVMNQSPCPFLMEDNACFVYPFRPKACREYPHTDQMEFSKNLAYHAPNSRYCPAVFHIIERLRKTVPV